MLRKLFWSALGGVLIPMWFIVAPVQAVSIDFDDVASHGGAVAYDGAGGPLTGTDVIFDQILGVGTPLKAGVALDCVGCVLNFMTGDNKEEGPTQWKWETGGSFVLTGMAKDGLTTVASGTLLTGSFTGPADPSALGFGSDIIVVGFGVDTKNVDLVAFYGLVNSDFQFVNTEISLGNTVIDSDGGFTGTVNNADLNNVNVPVPEPGSLFLLGSGLSAFGLLGWRRPRKGLPFI